MIPFDFYPTPVEIAEELIGGASLSSPLAIADFSAGDGALLQSAVRRWPAARVTAVDVQASLVRKLRSEFPDWSVGRCDFLSQNSTNRCHALRSLKHSVDLVVLNPPFSAHKKRWRHTTESGHGIECSTSMKFVLTSARYLRKGGEIVAVLPISAITGQKDRPARDAIQATKSFDVLRVLGRRTFKGCFAETAIVRIGERVAHDFSPSTGTSSPHELVEIHRGRLHVHLLSESRSANATEFIHSTDLTNGVARRSGRMTLQSNNKISGPAVLIPRVGRADPRKIACVGANRQFVLSDCVIALKPNDGKTKALREQMLAEKDAFCKLYLGTGAPFITLERLREFLNNLRARA